MAVGLAGFDAHTAVGDSLTATVAAELRGFSGTHGGYLAAIALRAMRPLAEGRQPLSLTVHLLTAVKPGELELAPRVDRSGSSMTTLSLRARQEARPALLATGVFGATRPTLSYDGLAMPDVPAPEERRPLVEKPVAEAAAGYLVEHRPAAEPLPLTGGGLARILVWMRLVEDRAIDALLATMLADAGPPALYGQLSEFVAMPSTEIALHFADVAAAAASPWALAHLRTGHAAGGYAIEDGELWTPGGRLVLQVRQQRRILQDD
jgi:acyl-CoA thioesterase